MTLVGLTEPRLWTRPLRPLTPKTTAGYEAISFAEDVLRLTLLPWQRWWLIHALELKTDGTFRFRTIITLMARQSGKTMLLKIVALYFMYVRFSRLILGAAQSLDIARESWQGAVELAEGNEFLAAEIANVRKANGEQCLTLNSGARYRISAATRSAGRGLSVDLLILDELREHRDWAAWGALSKTTTARPEALIVGISNAGDLESVVLNSLRDSAILGEDPSLALMEWSAPDGCELDDREGWAQANPGLGYTVTEQAIASALATDPPATFRTETLCQRVDIMDAAVNAGAWSACADLGGSLATSKDRISVCLDVALDGAHVTLAGAAMVGKDKVRVEILAAWDTTQAARADLYGLLARIKPISIGWYPTGPAAALAVDLRTANERLTGELRIAELPEIFELRGQGVSEICQEFVDLVTSRSIRHPDDPLLNAHVAGAQRLRGGDGWRFGRVGNLHVDAAYAAAGAVRLARTVIPPRPRSAIY